mgnify:CR=1 FL=1
MGNLIYHPNLYWLVRQPPHQRALRMEGFILYWQHFETWRSDEIKGRPELLIDTRCSIIDLFAVCNKHLSPCHSSNFSALNCVSGTRIHGRDDSVHPAVLCSVGWTIDCCCSAPSLSMNHPSPSPAPVTLSLVGAGVYSGVSRRVVSLTPRVMEDGGQSPSHPPQRGAERG